MAPIIHHEQLIETFGTEQVRRFPEATLPAGLTHQPTRTFLAETGLPTELRSGFLSTEDPADESWMQPLPELYQEMSTGRRGKWKWPLPEGAEHCYVLGRFEGGSIILDGSTGELRFIPDWNEPPSPLHSDVNALAYFMYLIEVNRDVYAHERVESEIGDDPDAQAAAYLAVARVLAERLYEADPTPFPEGVREPWANDFAGPWTVAFFDIAEGMWS
ncbi:hypothetical protein F7P10_16470 [Actinomadura sp. WMMB 499]|nr:hypothetical protein F7P10_16470 [Actinomadura sp. WMMB 499]